MTGAPVCTWHKTARLKNDVERRSLGTAQAGQTTGRASRCMPKMRERIPLRPARSVHRVGVWAHRSGSTTDSSARSWPVRARVSERIASCCSDVTLWPSVFSWIAWVFWCHFVLIPPHSDQFSNTTFQTERRARLERYLATETDYKLAKYLFTLWDGAQGQV